MGRVCALAVKDGGPVRLSWRNEKDLTRDGPAIGPAVGHLAPSQVVLDRELLRSDDPARILTVVDMDSRIPENRGMKTTIDIPENELKDAMYFTKAKTKREAVVRVLEEFNRRRRMAELVRYSGTFADSFPTNEQSEAVDAKRDLELHGRLSRR